MTTNTGEDYISRTSKGKYLFTIPKNFRKEGEQIVYTFDVLEDAVDFREATLINKGKITIPVINPFNDSLWDKVIQRQESIVKKDTPMWTPVVVKETKPFGIAWLSDSHIGNLETSLRTLRSDAELIHNTEGLYCEFHGDGWDNWIIGKLQNQQREQISTHRETLQLFVSWLGIIKDDLLWCVSGNHDLWTEKLAGVDLIGDYIPLMLDTNYLYDPYEIRVEVIGEGFTSKIITRHQWVGKSAYNITHAIEKAWKFGPYEFDIGVGGHTHQATLGRPFVTRKDTIAWAIMTGTYKLTDSYAVQLGLTPTVGTGVGVSIFYPDGRMFFVNDLQIGVDFLKWLRE